jgi:hypothetical protein
VEDFWVVNTKTRNLSFLSFILWLVLKPNVKFYKKILSLSLKLSQNPYCIALLIFFSFPLFSCLAGTFSICYYTPYPVSVHNSPWDHLSRWNKILTLRRITANKMNYKKVTMSHKWWMVGKQHQTLKNSDGAGHGGSCLQSQHQQGCGKKLNVLRSAWVT